MTGDTYSRRSVLRAGAGAVAAGATLGVSMPAHAQASFDGFLADTDNYDGVVDETGSDEVTIEVGVEANGGNWGYGPAAVRVDPGTTVTWEWMAGSHDVAAEDGSFQSELTNETGHTFGHTFESEGVTKYACTPHRSLGMRGVVVVGDADVGGGSAQSGGTTQSGSGGLPAKPTFDGFLADTGNYDGLADRTGSEEVTVEVGVEANGGNFGYGPAAIHVDPGTTVTWEWVAGSHDVAAEDDSFASELTNESGHTFSHTFESEGVTTYACTPHRSLGMRGAVVVGEPSLSGSGSGGSGSESGGSGSDGGSLTGGDWATVGFALSLVGGLLSPFGFMALRDDDQSR